MWSSGDARSSVRRLALLFLLERYLKKPPAALTVVALAVLFIDLADPRARVLVVDCEVMYGVDFSGLEALEGLIEDLRVHDVELRLARVHGPVLERLKTSGVLEKLGEDKVFPRVEAAVAGES